MNVRKHRSVVHVPRRLTPSAWGGTERVLQETLPLLGEHGYVPQIHTTQALDSAPLWELRGVAVKRHAYFYPEWPLSAERKLLYDQKGGNLVSFSLSRALSEMDDLSLLHLHTGNRLAAQCVQTAQRRGVPSVLTLHGGHFDIPSDERKNLVYARPSDPKSGFAWGRALSALWNTRKLLENVDAVVCVGVSEFDKARAAMPNQRVCFLPGGVDVNAFARGEAARGRELLKLDGERPLILCAARVDRQKSQDTLVGAWRALAGVECDLALVGPETSAGYSEELRSQAQGGPGRLVLSGAVPPDEMPHIFAAAQLSVLPSRHEPFGLTCLESWASGTCLIAADVGGPGWLLAGETEGRLFPVGDQSALGALLSLLLADQGQRGRLADAGRVRAQAEFTWKQRALRLGNLYDELLVAPKPRSGRDSPRNQKP